MKSVFCAYCGKQLFVYRKAVPSKMKIYDFIEPHNCLGEEERPEEFKFELVEDEKKPPIDLPQRFGKQKIVQLLNDLEPKTTNPLQMKTGDKRNKDHLRKELSSTAPKSLIDNIQGLSNSTPEGDIDKEPEEA